jgi:RES domain-containing protein
LRVYRAFQRKHEATALSGEGARLYGGRWNSVGTAVYTSTTFSLALLEIMVNASTPRIPRDMVYVPMDIPDEIRLDVLDTATLPNNWFDFPAPPECQLAGDSWVNSGQTVGLVVPSAVARIDTNILLNPAHPDFARIIVGNMDAMAIDHRLVRLKGSRS